jgi:hypothetical protein
MSNDYPSLDLGQLPAETINAVLGTELDAAPVHMSGIARRHVDEKRHEDYARYLPYVALVIAAPNFIGQAPKKRENIELIRRIPNTQGAALLVAVGLEMDEQGRYRVRSFYPLTPDELERKRLKGTIKPVPLKTTTPPP